MAHFTAPSKPFVQSKTVRRRFLAKFQTISLVQGSLQPIAFELLQYFISLAPLVSLLAFVTIPAYKRIVFEEGVTLLWTVFFGAYLGVLVLWLLTFEAVQEIVRNVTMSANATHNWPIDPEL